MSMYRRFLRIGMLLLLVLGGVSHAQEEPTRAVDAYVSFEEQLQNANRKNTGHVLKDLYVDMYQEYSYLSEEQVDRDMERLYGVQESSDGYFGVDVETGEVTSTTAVAQLFQREQMARRRERILEINREFAHVDVLAKYLSLFMDGDEGNSGFDIWHNLNELEGYMVEDTVKTTLRSQLLPVSPQISYEMGRSDYPVEITDQELLRDLSSEIAGRTAFPEEGIPVCSVVQPERGYEVDAPLTDKEKEAVLYGLAFAETSELLKNEFTSAEDFLAVPETIRDRYKQYFPSDDQVRQIIKNLTGSEPTDLTVLDAPAVAVGLMDTFFNWVDDQDMRSCYGGFCTQIDFILAPSRPAPPSSQIIRPYSMKRNLESMVKRLFESAKRLKSTRVEARNIFTFPWLNPDGEFFKFFSFVNIQFVPIFSNLQPSEYFKMNEVLNKAEQQIAWWDGDALLEDDVNRANSFSVLSDIAEASAKRDYLKEQHELYAQLEAKTSNIQEDVKILRERLRTMGSLMRNIRAATFSLRQTAQKFSELPRQ